MVNTANLSRRSYIKKDVKLQGLYPSILKHSQKYAFVKIFQFAVVQFAILKCVMFYFSVEPGRVAQSVGHLTRKSGVLGSIPGLATYFRFSFRFFKKGSCQLLAKVCARSTG